MPKPTDPLPRQSRGTVGELPADTEKPLLMVDIDGVISLFGFPIDTPPRGAFHSIDGIPHFLSAAAGEHLLALSLSFELVWASGWEEKANEYLPHLLGLPRGLPCLRFGRATGGMGGAQETGSTVTRAHWKLDAIDAHAGPEHPLAWIDDAFNDACHEWAAARAGPTLLVPTLPHAGLTEREERKLGEWLMVL